MNNLNQLELQNLRHLIGSHETAYQKLQAYANECTDPTVIKMLQKSAQDAKATKQKLISLLG